MATLSSFEIYYRSLPECHPHISNTMASVNAAVANYSGGFEGWPGKDGPSPTLDCRGHYGGEDAIHLSSESFLWRRVVMPPLCVCVCV